MVKYYPAGPVVGRKHCMTIFLTSPEKFSHPPPAGAKLLLLWYRSCKIIAILRKCPDRRVFEPSNC